MKITHVQGSNRYLIDLEHDSLAQVADTADGRLYPPRLIHSILARGYWEEVLAPSPDQLTAVLDKVQPI